VSYPNAMICPGCKVAHGLEWNGDEGRMTDHICFWDPTKEAFKCRARNAKDAEWFWPLPPSAECVFVPSE
jgi:hypothetical protein